MSSLLRARDSCRQRQVRILGQQPKLRELLLLHLRGPRQLVDRRRLAVEEEDGMGDVVDDDSRALGGVPAQPAKITATKTSKEHFLAHLNIELRIVTYRQS